MQGLVLSSVIFGLAHIPSNFYAPVLEQDWAQFSINAKSFLPGLIFQTGFGFIFGALWLRTGSIILISIVHFVFNIGGVLVGGLNGL